MPADPYVQTLLAQSTSCYGNYSPTDGECSECVLSKPCSSDRIRNLRRLAAQVRSVGQPNQKAAKTSTTSPTPGQTKSKIARPVAATNPDPVAPPRAAVARNIFPAVDDSVCGSCGSKISLGENMYVFNMSVYHEGCHP